MQQQFVTSCALALIPLSSFAGAGKENDFGGRRVLFIGIELLSVWWLAPPYPDIPSSFSGRVLCTLCAQLVGGGHPICSWESSSHPAAAFSS